MMVLGNIMMLNQKEVGMKIWMGVHWPKVRTQPYFLRGLY